MLDLAELYVALYADLRAKPAAWLANVAAGSVHGKRVDRNVVAIRAGTLQIADRPTDEVKFAVAAAIHDTLADLDGLGDVTTDPTPKPLRRYRDRLLRTGNLRTSGKAGALLTSRLVPTRPRDAPSTLPDLLPRLRPLSGDEWAQVAWVRAAALDDFSIDPSGVADLTVAGLAMLAERADVTVERVDLDAGAYYTGRPDPAVLTARVPTALAALDASGAHIAVLPELACDDEILLAWQEACRTTPSTGPLTFIVVGSGPTHTATPGSRVATDLHATPDSTVAADPNRAVLLSRRTGDVLLAQDKRRPFDMSDTYLVRVGLDQLRPGPVNELLPASPALVVFDTRAGRFAILICEDLGRLTDIGALAVHAGVTHVLTPIFAPPILAKGWQQTAAASLLNDGVTVAVSNGLTLGREHLDSSYRPNGTQATTLLLLYPTPLDGGPADAVFRPAGGPVPASAEQQALTAHAVPLS